MKSKALVLACFVLVWVLFGATVWADMTGDMFIIRSSRRAPDAVVQQIEQYAQEHNLVYLGSDKVKRGEVSLVKICIRPAGAELWKAGLHVSAMLPCGNIGVYREDGVTKISLLHPRFMHMIYPDTNVERAVEIATPVLLAMMDEIGF